MLSSKGFDLWADGYDKSVGLSDESDSYPFAGYKMVLGNIYASIMESGRKRVLDIGFGTGTLTAKLYAQGCEIFGQDFSQRMRDIAQEKMPDAKLYIGDFANGLVPELASHAYDHIVATYSLHHLNMEGKVAFINELYARLAPGGTLFIGDVAFETADVQAICRDAAGDEWDDDEIYINHDELLCFFPEMTFEKISFCAAILTLTKN